MIRIPRTIRISLIVLWSILTLMVAYLKLNHYGYPAAAGSPIIDVTDYIKFTVAIAIVIVVTLIIDQSKTKRLRR